jgi:hypothetical protein
VARLTTSGEGGAKALHAALEHGHPQTTSSFFARGRMPAAGMFNSNVGADRALGTIAGPSRRLRFDKPPHGAHQGSLIIALVLNSLFL